MIDYAVSMVASLASTATSAIEYGLNQYAGVPALVCTIVSSCVFIASAALKIYEKIREAKRRQDKLDKEEPADKVEEDSDNDGSGESKD